MLWFGSVRPALATACACAILSGCAAAPQRPPAVHSSPTAPAPRERNPQALAHYATAVSLEAREGVAAALPEYEKAFDLDPHSTALASKLAQIYLSQGQREKALSMLERAAKANPTSAEPWYWRGMAHRAGEENTEATAALLEALKLQPDFLPALRALVECYFQKNELHVVPALLDRAFNQNPTDANFWIGLGDLYQFVLKQKPSLANEIPSGRPLDCYEKARQLRPRDPELLLRLAEAYSAGENFTAAAETYTTLLKLRPDLMPLRERLAYAWLRAGQVEKAIEAFKAILRRDPLRYELHNIIAELYEQLQRDADAVTHLQQSLEINPNQYEAYVQLALAQMRQKHYTQALDTLSVARKKFPTRFQSVYLTGVIFAEQKDYAKAVAAYAEAEQLLKDELQGKPASAFYFSYGAACERAGQYEKAAALFRKSLELDPNNHNAANYLGYMWADRNENLNEALELIQKAVSLQPDNAAYLDSLGWVYYRLGRLEDALKHLRRAIELSAKEPDPILYDHLADVLHALNQREEAIQALRKAIELDPKNKDYTEKLKRWTGR
ncbi:MAG: tetratricopeptide repeat protein [Verrucomicrobiae bacterium]|nr:tetratricopeptide repeat protein [Verrucomicrobiae bacterium]